MFSKSAGFIKWWPRCLDLNVSKAWQSQWTFEVVSDTCMHRSHLGMFTSPRCPFNWQCPVTNLVNILSWFLLRLSNFPAFFADGFLRNPLACLCPHMDCQGSSCFPLVRSLITPLATFEEIANAGSVPISGCEEPCLADSKAISFLKKQHKHTQFHLFLMPK